MSNPYILIKSSDKIGSDTTYNFHLSSSNALPAGWYKITYAYIPDAGTTLGAVGIVIDEARSSAITNLNGQKITFIAPFSTTETAYVLNKTTELNQKILLPRTTSLSVRITNLDGVNKTDLGAVDNIICLKFLKPDDEIPE